MATTPSKSIIATGVSADTKEDELTLHFQSRSISGSGDVEGVPMRNDSEAKVKLADPQDDDDADEHDRNQSINRAEGSPNKKEYKDEDISADSRKGSGNVSFQYDASSDDEPKQDTIEVRNLSDVTATELLVYSSDVDKVQNKATVTEVPYYAAFGPPKAMKDLIIPKLPDRITIEIQPSVAEFITSTGEHQALVEKEMNDVNATIDWKSSQEGTVEIDHNLTTDMKDIQTLVTTWSKKAVERAEMIFDKFTSKETKAPPELWPKLCERLQEMKSTADQSELLIEYDDKNNTVTFTGLAQCVTMANDAYEKIVKEIEEKMRIEATMVTDKCPNVTIEKLQLLQMIGIESKLPVDDVEINIYPDQNNITFKGRSSVVMETKSHILRTLSEVQERELKLAPDILKLIKQGFGYVGKHLTHKCQVVVRVDTEGLQITAMSRRDLDIAVGILENLIIRDEIPVKQEWKPVLDDMNFQMLISKLVSEFLIDIQTAKSKDGSPVIKFLGTEDGVDKATKKIKKFMKNNAILTKIIDAPATVVQLFFSHRRSYIDLELQGLRNHKVKIKQTSYGVRITGMRTGVTNATAAVDRILSSFVTEEMTIDKPGARKCFQQGNTTNIQWLSLIEKEHKCAINVKCTTKDTGKPGSHGAVTHSAAETIDVAPKDVHEDVMEPRSWYSGFVRRSNSQDHSRYKKSQSSPCHSGHSDEITTPEGIEISLKQGDITKQKADVLVNTCGGNLKLTGTGGVANAFGNAGGAKLQQYCDAIGGANAGDVVETKPAGSLECQAIYHAVTPSSSSGSHGQTMCDIVNKCLTMAHTDNHRSMAFPAIGTGILGYPSNVVAQSMYDEIFRFSKRNPNTSLKKIYLMVFDPITQKEFQIEVGQRHGVPPANIPTAYASSPDLQSQDHRSKGIMHTSFFSKCRYMYFSQPSMASQASTLLASSPSPGQQTTSTSIGGVKVEVQKGDITKEKTDVIVNCTSGNISQGGGVTRALLSAGGTDLQKACQQYSTQPKGSVVSTVGGNLPCQNVYHMVNPPPQNLQASVIKCLEMAETSGMNSIAFPAAGTGSHGTSVQQCAESLLDGIHKFTSQSPPRNLQLVRITVFLQNQLPVFHAQMNNYSATTAVSTSTPVTKKKVSQIPAQDTQTFSKVKDFLKGGTPSYSSKNPEPITLVITAVNTAYIKSAKDGIDKFLSDQLSETPLKNPMIAKLNKMEFKSLVCLGQEHDVKVEEYGSGNVLKLSGKNTDVLTVYTEISQFLDAKKDELLQKSIQWHRQERDNLHAITHQGSALPSTWDPQPLNNNQPVTCHRVNLPPEHAEYQKVQSAFSKGAVALCIKSVERIQNPYLWQQYCTQRDKMNAQNKQHGANEMYLFHGTSEDSIDNINNKGFNRSFSGREHGTRFGNGTYFASNAGTSVGYAKQGESDYRYMYYAKVLVGEYTQGQSRIALPPPKNPGNPYDVYDTTVDNPNSPSVFVIFHDNQGYPEYLIKFQ